MITLITGVETRYFLRISIGRELLSRIAAHENNAWTEYASEHQDIEILNKTFSCMTNNEFWEIVDRIPELAFKRNLQIRTILAYNTGSLVTEVWSSTYLLCKDGRKSERYFLFFVCLP